MTVLLAGWLATNRKSPDTRHPMTLCLLGVLGLLTLSAMSCQNQFAGFNSVSQAPLSGTPTGTYVITITGTLGSNGNVTHSTTVNLSVGPG
jgi:hypothetical protein